MTLRRKLIAAALVIAAVLPVTMAGKNVNAPKKVYMFGFAASFNDTIVHFTEIQAIDSAWITKKTHFLMGREYYSNMLREYLNQQQMPHRTCIVIFDEKLKKIQKKYLKMKKLYTAEGKKVKNKNDVRTIATSEFKFTPVNMSYNIE